MTTTEPTEAEVRAFLEKTLAEVAALPDTDCEKSAAERKERAKALSHGADKYGPWNWRGSKVELMTYLGAMKRHIDRVLEGEDIDPESGAHHLGHVAASCAIALDALRHGTLVDNRPPRDAP